MLLLASVAAFPAPPRRVTPPPVSGAISVPTINFTAGVGSSQDLTQYVSGWNPATMALMLQGFSLPTGITFNGTALVYDGAGGATSVTGITLVVIML